MNMDAAALAALVKASREFEVVHEGITVRARIPTKYEVQRFFNKHPDAALGDIAMEFAVGWSGVRACDLVSGDDVTAAPFSRELFAEYAGERPALIAAVSGEMIKRYNERTEQMEGEAKN